MTSWQHGNTGSVQADEAEEEVTPKDGDSRPIRRRRLSHAVPTARIAFSKQLDLLRGYAALSGTERRIVTLAEVAPLVNMTAGTASLANAFFTDAGMIERQESGFVPTQATIEYHQAHEWDPVGAAEKLATPLKESWGWDVIAGRLAFSQLPEDGAIRALAEGCGASKDYEPQLRLMLSYFEAAGLIERDGGILRLARSGADVVEPPKAANAAVGGPGEEKPPQPPSAAATAGSGEPLVASTVHPALVGLLQLLPAPRTSWKQGKQNWIRAFTATIDAIYPDDDLEGGGAEE